MSEEQPSQISQRDLDEISQGYMGLLNILAGTTKLLLYRDTERLQEDRRQAEAVGDTERVKQLDEMLRQNREAWELVEAGLERHEALNRDLIAKFRRVIGKPK
jgi:hypothetical protein